MAENIKENIFYTPDIKPDRHYESDAEFLKQTKKEDHVSPEPELDYSKTKVIEDLKDTMTQMEKLLRNIDDVAHLAPSVLKLKKRLEVAFPEGYVVPPKEVEPIRTEAEDAIKEKGAPIYTPEETGYTPDSIFEPGEDGIELSIIEPRSILNIAIASYARDTVDLQKYYVDSMQAILQSYYNQMLTIAAEAGIPDYSILEKPVYAERISAPANLAHLKDFIARSQTSRQQKTKYFKKTHNTDQTMVHMRRWHSAEKERERYYSEDYGSADSILAHESNELLMISRRMYDKQYQQTFYDMYKYLDSSVSIANDILSMSVNEAKAKGFLIKNGVNVLNAIVKETKRQYLDKTVADEPDVSATDKDGNKIQDNNDSNSDSNSNTDSSSESIASFTNAPTIAKRTNVSEEDLNKPNEVAFSHVSQCDAETLKKLRQVAFFGTGSTVDEAKDDAAAQIRKSVLQRGDLYDHVYIGTPRVETDPLDKSKYKYLAMVYLP